MTPYCYGATCPNPVKTHYQSYPYPHYPLFASVRRCDTYALNLFTLWTRFNGYVPPPDANRILLTGCGTFSPYPWSVANPHAKIMALDLSDRSLDRARLHCLLHGRRNIEYRCGDLLDETSISGQFGLIDSFGVLHHLDDPLAGLKKLEKHLLPGGILRIMLYSRYARREEESIRRALRIINIRTPDQFKYLLERARPGSRLTQFMAASDEVDTKAGIADALLHPLVHTYRIDEFLDLVCQTGLEPLLFAHHGARENIQEEILRLRMFEKEGRSPGNFVLYLGKRATRAPVEQSESVILLNRCLTSAVGTFKIGAITIGPRIGVSNPPLGFRERRFLRRFVEPVPRTLLASSEIDKTEHFKRLLFVSEYALTR